MMVPSTKSVAWKYLSSQSLHDGIYQFKHCIMIPDHHMYCTMISFLTCIAWWYHTSHVVHDDSFHCMQCMRKSFNPCIALRNHTTPALHINTYSSWWYLSTHALHDDTWSRHALHDDTNQNKQCTSLTLITWSSHLLHDDTIHQMHCIIAPGLYFTFIAWWHHSGWWYHSSHAVHDDTTHR